MRRKRDYGKEAALRRERNRRNRNEPTVGELKKGLGSYKQKQTHTDAMVRLTEVPEDTRSPAQVLMGDPLPGRSALDRRWMGCERR